MRAPVWIAKTPAFLLSIALSACGTPSSGGATAAPESLDESVDLGGDEGPTGRRVMLIVKPGDASVEVDGVAIRRRDGVIELTGRVGQTRRLRVFKGAQSVEKDVTIQEAGASPPLLDLDAREAPVAGARGPKAAGTAAPGATAIAPGNPLLGDKFE